MRDVAHTVSGVYAAGVRTALDCSKRLPDPACRKGKVRPVKIYACGWKARSSTAVSILAILSATLISSCGSSGSNAADIDSMQEFAKAEMPGVSPDLVQAACDEGAVNVALDAATNYERIVEAFHQQFPCIAAAPTISEDDDNLARFIAAHNQGNPPDVVSLGSDITAKEKLADAGLLAEYEPSGGSLVHSIAPGFLYSPNRLAQGIIYNTNSIKAQDIEKISTWSDIGLLSGPAFEGRRLGVVDPHGAGGGSYMVAYVLHKEAGNDVVSQVLKARDVTVYAGSGPAVDAVASGEIDLMVGNDFNALAAAENGAPLQVVYPSPGSNTYTAMGIAAKATNPNAAKLFEEFIFSKPGQALYPLELQMAPGRSDVQDTRSVAETSWYRPAAEPFDYSPEDMLKSYDAVVEPYPSK